MRKLMIVMYHYVRNIANSRFPEIKGLEYYQFKNQIKYLTENYTVIRMEDVIEAYATNGNLPDNAVLLTFDDGYIDHFTNVFPVLMEHKIQGSFFIPGKTFAEHKLLDVNKVHFTLASTAKEQLLSEIFKQLDYYRDEYGYPSNKELFNEYAVANRFDCKETIFIKRILQTVLPESVRNIISSNLFEKFVGISEENMARELYMNKEQLKCMKDAGMHIGIHGYDHYWLGNISENQMTKDILKALDVMSDLIDNSSWVMNYPYGSYNDEIIQYIKKNGCKVGITTKVNIADIKLDNQFALPRLDTNDFPPKSFNYNSYMNSRELQESII